MTFSSQQKEALRIAEYKARDCARSHIDAAKRLYAERDWSRSCFLAMTAIEEIGKSLQFQLASVQDDGSVLEEQRKHRIKAVFGAVAPLIMNDEARARHGRNPATRIDRLTAISLLGEAPGEWMALRNKCLYVDLAMTSATVSDPAHQIIREHAYLMIVGALEAYAQVHAPDFGYREISIEQFSNDAWQRRVVGEIVAFVTQESGHVDLDRLDFVANVDRVTALKDAVSHGVDWP